MGGGGASSMSSEASEVKKGLHELRGAFAPTEDQEAVDHQREGEAPRKLPSATLFESRHLRFLRCCTPPKSPISHCPLIGLLVLSVLTNPSLPVPKQSYLASSRTQDLRPGVSRLRPRGDKVTLVYRPTGILKRTSRSSPATSGGENVYTAEVSSVRRRTQGTAAGV